MGVFEKEFTVQFGDVDMQNRLTLKGAYRLMQEAANCHSDQAGYGINNIEKTDYSWVLYEQRCRIYARPCWNTGLRIKTWSRGAEGLICLRDFEVRTQKGDLVALASTSWLLVSASTQKMVRIPAGMMEEYGTVDRSVFEDPLVRLRPAPEEEKTWEYTVLKRDLDINRHVNNLCYLDFALEALPSGMALEDFDEVEVMYKKAAHLGDRIACFAGRTERGATVSVKEAESGRLLTVLRLQKNGEN